MLSKDRQLLAQDTAEQDGGWRCWKEPRALGRSPTNPRWAPLPRQPQGRLLLALWPWQLHGPRLPCPSTQPENQGAQCSQMRRMFYICHLLPHRPCHLAPSQPGYFLPNASFLHHAQGLQHVCSPGGCCHFQIASGQKLVLFSTPRCVLPQMPLQHPPPPQNPWGTPSWFAGAFSFTPYHFTFSKLSCPASFPWSRSEDALQDPKKRA